MIEIRRAEWARRRGDRFDAQAYKRRLWRELFGSDLDDELLELLTYVDASNRYVFTDNGWVQDGGDVLFASGADPAVVALMVAAAIAKGWISVEISGDPAFLVEAQQQFEAAGIEVSIRGEPRNVKFNKPVQKPLPLEAENLDEELFRLEIEMDELQKPSKQSNIEFEIRHNLSNLRIKHAELNGRIDELNDGISGKVHSLPLISKVLDGILYRKYNKKLEISKLDDELEKVKSEIDFNRHRLAAHKDQMEAERVKRLRETGRRIIELQAKLRRMPSLDSRLGDDPCFDERVPMRT